MPEKLAFSGSSAVEVGGKVTTATEWRLSGGSKVRIPSLDADRLQVRASGSTDFTLDGKLETADFRLSGSSKLALGGSCGTLVLKQSGSCTAIIGKCRTAELRLSGSSSVQLEAEKLLDVQASGASRILYSGEPEVKLELSGSARVSKRQAGASPATVTPAAAAGAVPGFFPEKAHLRRCRRLQRTARSDRSSRGRSAAGSRRAATPSACRPASSSVRRHPE